MSAIVKEYSCTPMEPIRIQRRLVQSHSLSLSSLSLLSRWIHDAGGEAGRRWPGGQATFRSRPFLPLFGRWFPIYKLSLLYEPQRYVPTRAPILFRLRVLCNLAEVRTSCRTDVANPADYPDIIIANAPRAFRPRLLGKLYTFMQNILDLSHKLIDVW